ncbi:hypothetical protein GCM10010145_06050 [Streptomyces ruber]|uniref:Uncharacterized protein n=2 Tax=Streptomyces TaxID=1883 RepID=A0A918EN65_9ACTN|nr:hypothetical protein [Streptomyces ruber]GGQ40789.1 hypothetical protein GCM10010145_06050 [Streptomyces ruber]
MQQPGPGDQPPVAPPGFGPPPQMYGAPPAPQYAPPPYAPPPVPPAPPVPQGPEFLAVDRHNSIVVDAAGVAFEDHGRGIEFSWHQVRSIHYRPGDDGRSLVMGVVHVDGPFYECVVDAKGRDRMNEWIGRLLPVLQFYRPLS